MTAFFSALLLALLLFTGAAVQAQEADLPAVEQEKIENLINAVEHLSEAAFIRNGKPYDAITAARFLRAKLRSREPDVRSANDFIEKIASFSSTTGKPYLIRFTDGREVSSAEFFRAHLAEMEETR